jgi:pimeloyl-ACP methyl ester carboxylesterase
VSLPRCRRAAESGDPVRVLLLHGLGGGPTVWDRLVTHAADPLELWCAKLPWHGSGGRDWSRRLDPVDVVADVVRADGSGPGFDAVVAHSYATSLLVEAFASGRVASRPAVLISPFYRSDPADFDWATISYFVNNFHLPFAEALRISAASRFPQTHRDRMAMHVRDRIGPYGWMRFFDSYLRSPFIDLAAVVSPMLALTGSADNTARPEDGRALADALPQGRFHLLAGCGHFPMLEQPSLLARLLLDFLSTIPHLRRGGS